jgi:hypothetical protein
MDSFSGKNQLPEIFIYHTKALNYIAFHEKDLAHIVYYRDGFSM